MLDYALPKIQAECDGAYDMSYAKNPQKAIRCHFVNLVPVFQGHMDYFAAGDVPPNPTGSQAMATAVGPPSRSTPPTSFPKAGTTPCRSWPPICGRSSRSHASLASSR